jgi:hypothetical protein
MPQSGDQVLIAIPGAPGKRLSRGRRKPARAGLGGPSEIFSTFG